MEGRGASPFGSNAVTRSDAQVELTLAKDDVVKIHVGAHIDGFASVSAETLVVGTTAGNPVTGPRADAIKAAWTAAEICQRLIKVGEKNWTVTDAISKIALSFGTKPVEGESPGPRARGCESSRFFVGMLSCDQLKNVIDGKKRIIQAPTEGARSGVDTVSFAEGDVWGLDILITSGTDGKVGSRSVQFAV